MALFNEHSFWDGLREGSDIKKRNYILKYEALFGSLKDMDIRQTRFYRNYLSMFDFPFRVNIPEDLEEDFDWDLLYRLIAGSYSSEMRLEINPKWLDNPTDEILVDIYIKVKHGNTEIEKTLDELWSFQILRLYEIYIEEQMNILVAVYDDDNDDYFEIEDDEEEITECDVSKLQPVTDPNDDEERLGKERNIRFQKFIQQIHHIHEEIEKNNAKKASDKEIDSLELLLDEQQEQSYTSTHQKAAPKDYKKEPQ